MVIIFLIDNWDEKDPKEVALKKIVDTNKEEVNKAKDNNKEALYKLKKAYEKLNTFAIRCDTDVMDSVRKMLINIIKLFF